jgi:hypothetical protein
LLTCKLSHRCWKPLECGTHNPVILQEGDPQQTEVNGTWRTHTLACYAGEPRGDRCAPLQGSLQHAGQYAWTQPQLARTAPTHLAVVVGSVFTTMCCCMHKPSSQCRSRHLAKHCTTSCCAPSSLNTTLLFPAHWAPQESKGVLHSQDP